MRIYSSHPPGLCLNSAPCCPSSIFLAPHSFFKNINHQAMASSAKALQVSRLSPQPSAERHLIVPSLRSNHRSRSLVEEIWSRSPFRLPAGSMLPKWCFSHFQKARSRMPVVYPETSVYKLQKMKRDGWHTHKLHTVQYTVFVNQTT